jgi:Tol biopolymer transport system component
VVKELPRELERIILRCLRKDPAKRLQAMADLVIELDEVRTESSSQLAAAPPARRRRAVWLLAAGAALTGAVVGAWVLWPRAPLSPAPVATPLTSFPGDELSPALSPDGKQVAFAWNGDRPENFDLYVMQVGSSTPLRLTRDPAYDDLPAWSPDATQLAFVRREPTGSAGSLWLISALGGSERKLADLRVRPTQISWTPDGEYVVLDTSLSAATQEIVRVAVKSSETSTLLSKPLREGRYQFPVVSPDGKYLAFAGATGRTGPGWHLHVVPLTSAGTPSGEPRRVTIDQTAYTGVAWASDSRSIVYSGQFSRQLWRVPLTGAAERLLTGVMAGSPSIASAGARLAYVADNINPDLWKSESGGPPIQFASSSFADYDAQFSTDGSKIAFVSGRSGNLAIWVANADGSSAVRLTQEAGKRPGSPHWSPDDRRIVYDTQLDDGHSRIFIIDAAGGRPRRLTSTTGEDDEALPTWSRDGKSIYFRWDQSGRNEIWRAPADGGPAVQVSRNGGSAPWESWDGQTLFYTTGSGMSRELLAIPVGGGAERRIIEGVAAWLYFPARDGVYFVARLSSNDPHRYEVRFAETATGTTRVVSRIESRGTFPSLTVSPDGKTVVHSGIPTSANADLMLLDHFR